MTTTMSRGTGSPKPTTTAPTPPGGNGPGRWADEGGIRPDTTTTRIPRRPRVTAS